MSSYEKLFGVETPLEGVVACEESDCERLLDPTRTESCLVSRDNNDDLPCAVTRTNRQTFQKLHLQ